METKTQECEKSKRVFETIITLLGQKAEISHKYTGKNIVLNVTSEDPGRLIGRRGIALNSITHLMNLVLKREDSDHPHVVIDVKGLGEEKSERGNRKDKRRNNNRNDKRRNNNRNNNANQETASKEGAPAKEEAKIEDAPVKEEANNTLENNAPVKEEAKSAPAPEEKAPAEAKEAPAKEEANQEAPQQKKPEPKKKLSRLEIECRNSAREVKKWGEDTHLPPMNEGDCFKVLDYFKEDKEIVAEIDESRTSGDKKRVKLSLKN